MEHEKLFYENREQLWRETISSGRNQSSRNQSGDRERARSGESKVRTETGERKREQGVTIIKVTPTVQSRERIRR